MAEDAQRQADAHWCNLIPLRAQIIRTKAQVPRVRPEPFTPLIHVIPGIEAVEGVNHAVTVRVVGTEVEPAALQVIQCFENQLNGALPIRHGWIGVIALVVERRIVRARDVIGVGQQSIGDVIVIVAHRAVVSVSGVALLVTEIDDVITRNRTWHIGEIDEQADAHNFTRRRSAPGRPPTQDGPPLTLEARPGSARLGCRCDRTDANMRLDAEIFGPRLIHPYTRRHEAVPIAR